MLSMKPSLNRFGKSQRLFVCVAKILEPATAPRESHVSLEAAIVDFGRLLGRAAMMGSR